MADPATPGMPLPTVAGFDRGAADEIHGESGDDTIYAGVDNFDDQVRGDVVVSGGDIANVPIAQLEAFLAVLRSHRGAVAGDRRRLPVGVEPAGNRRVGGAGRGGHAPIYPPV